MTLETKCPALHPFKDEYRCFHDNTPCLYKGSETQCTYYQMHMRDKAMKDLGELNITQELETQQFNFALEYGK